jgi:hypothetical protein
MPQPSARGLLTLDKINYHKHCIEFFDWNTKYSYNTTNRDDIKIKSIGLWLWWGMNMEMEVWLWWWRWLRHHGRSPLLCDGFAMLLHLLVLLFMSLMWLLYTPLHESWCVWPSKGRDTRYIDVVRLHQPIPMPVKAFERWVRGLFDFEMLQLANLY